MPPTEGHTRRFTDQASESDMSFIEDRRNPHVSRVSLATLVDICCQDGADSPFQGESKNVSGRGMHVRTSYLPEIGEQLVCRFEHESSEILVEGRVAWRAEGEDSGEFGIQFTALDADSAHVLEELGARHSAPPRSGSLAVSSDHLESEDEDDDLLQPGQRVRLHVEGLAAPMKAAVHEGNDRKIRVGSNLEFLTMGRSLELESADGEVRRGASVDAVNVVVNPASGVPELVVQLRYDGVGQTPAPGGARHADDGMDFDDDAFGSSSDEVQEFDDDQSGWEPAAEALKARLGGAWQGASSVAGQAGGMLGKAWSEARRAAGRLTPEKKKTTSRPARSGRGAASPLPSSRRRSQRAQRSAARAPSHLRSGIHDLGLTGKSRPTKKAAPVARQASSKGRRWGALAVALLLIGGSTYGIRALSAEAQPAQTASEQQAEERKQPAVAKAKAAEQTQAPNESAPSESPEGIVADVPLFGPKAMATAEPVETQEADESEVDDATAEKLAAAASVEDQSWQDEEASAPADVKPWGKGRLHLPTVHRIRLDAPGQDLSGSIEPSGFTVVVPGSKAMESGRAIEKRDKRIVQVKASNTARGARVRFEFRGPVPPYRVRLRKDFVEFLISAPQEGVAQL